MPRATEGRTMKALLTYGLSVALGLTPALAWAQVGLSRPMPLEGPGAPIAGGGVSLQPIVRAQSLEEIKPLPPGPLATPGGATPGGLTPGGISPGSPVEVKSAPLSPAIA